MKKTLSFVLVAAMLLCMIPAFGIFADEVIEIDSAEDFLAIVDKLDGNYKLTKDITLDNQFVGLKADGGVDEGKYFKGTLDGNGKTITFNLTHHNNGRTGLFAQVDGCTIKNLTVKANVNLTGTTANGNSTAAVVGTVKSGATTTFSNVKVTGTISSDKSLSQGSIVGAIEGNGTTVFENCSSTATQSMTGRNDDSGLGGLAGSTRNDNATVKFINCTVNAELTSTKSVGGFIGRIRYAGVTLETTGGSVSGKFTGTNAAGGVLGLVTGANSTITVNKTKLSATLVSDGTTGEAVGSDSTGNCTITVTAPDPETPDTPNVPTTGDFMVVAVLLSVVALAGVAVVSKKRIAC